MARREITIRMPGNFKGQNTLFSSHSRATNKAAYDAIKLSSMCWPAFSNAEREDKWNIIMGVSAMKSYKHRRIMAYTVAMRCDRLLRYANEMNPIK